VIFTTLCLLPVSLTKYEKHSVSKNLLIYRRARIVDNGDSKVPANFRKILKYLMANATLFGYLFIYRYIMEIDEKKIYTYNISVGVCLLYCWPDVALQLGCFGAELM
jgi:hypothetical protein